MIGNSNNNNNKNFVDMRLKRLHCQLCCMNWQEEDLTYSKKNTSENVNIKDYTLQRLLNESDQLKVETNKTVSTTTIDESKDDSKDDTKEENKENSDGKPISLGQRW